MSTALLAKNKLVFINGTLLKPQDDDLLYHAWIRCNSMVVSWIRNLLSSQICSSIMYLDDAKEIWLDLRDRFSQCDSTRIYQLKQKIMSLTQGDDDINTYFTNLRIVWDEYKHTQPLSWCVCTTCRCQNATKWHIHQESECVMQFLIGLNSSYSQIRSHILSMVPLPSLSKAFSLVLQEERQRTLGGIDTPRYNHTLPPAPSEQPYSANAASSYFNRGKVCTHCGKPNHTVDKCFSLHGYPPSFGKGKFKPNSSSRDYTTPKYVNFVDDSLADSSDKSSTPSAMPTFDQCQQLITLLQSQLATGSPSIPPSAAQQTQSPIQSSSLPFTGTTLYHHFVANISVPSPIWLLDTGATHHVCCNLSFFKSAYPVHNASVKLPNGTTAPITHIGTICLTPHITLHYVLFVPSFTFNLYQLLRVRHFWWMASARLGSGLRRRFAMAEWIAEEVMRVLREPRRMSATRWGHMSSKVRKACVEDNRARA